MTTDNPSSLLQSHALLLAQDAGGPPLAGEGVATPSGGGDGTGQAPPPAGDSALLFMFLPIVLLMILFSVFGQRKEKKKREAMLGSIKKHDRVRTIGGVIGAVVEIKPDTIVLKVDESSNTRMTFTRDAVQQVMEKDPMRAIREISSSSEKAAFALA